MQLVPCTWLALQSFAHPSATRVLRPECGRVRDAVHTPDDAKGSKCRDAE